MVLETNSLERTQLDKDLLKELLGKEVVFQQTLIESLEQKMNSFSGFTKQDKETVNLEAPELSEHIKAMAKARWHNGFVKLCLLLVDKTPKEAAKTEAGRERLEALLLEYESYDLQMSDNLFKVDIPYLRRELGLA